MAVKYAVIRPAALERYNGGETMDEMKLAFTIWCIVGLLFIGLGVYAFFSKKPRPMGFWANVKMAPIKNIKKYNAAMGKLFCTFGVVFILLGTPLLAGQNSPWIILSMLGVMLEVIITMAVYTTVIEKKYKD